MNLLYLVEAEYPDTVLVRVWRLLWFQLNTAQMRL